MKYENAANVLPKKLLKAVRMYFPDGLLFLPKTNDPRPERDELVAKLIERKVPVKEVAATAGISPRQVYRIIKRQQEKQPEEESDKN